MVVPVANPDIEIGVDPRAGKDGRQLVPRLATDPAEAVRVANLVDVVRGYEGVKMANIETYREALAAALPR